MDNLLLAMGSLDKNHRGCHGYPASLRYVKSFQFALETVSRFAWNSCPVCRGISVQFGLEYAGGRPYLIMQGGRGRELDVSRWNPKEKNFSGVGEWYKGDAEALTVLRFHVNYMIQQALIEIKKRNMKVAELYDEMVDMIADKFWISSVKEPVKLYFWKRKEFLDNAIGDANRRFADPPKKIE